jgi:hypothetical protein
MICLESCTALLCHNGSPKMNLRQHQQQQAQRVNMCSADSNTRLVQDA